MAAFGLPFFLEYYKQDSNYIYKIYSNTIF